jgi:hypothetical protein
MAGDASGVVSPRPRFIRNTNVAQPHIPPGESQTDSTLNHSTKAEYEAQYARRILNTDVAIEAPNKSLTNSHHDALYSLWEAFGAGGNANVYRIWENVIKPANPKLAIMIGQHPALKGGNRWKFTKASSLYTMPPIEYLHKDIIVKNAVCLVYGQSGVGKSFVVLDWSLEIAQNADVLYVAGEGYQGYADRVKAWCNWHKKDEGRLYFTGDPVNLYDNQSVETFLLEIEISGMKPSLIVFDTLARCTVGAEENSAKDMGVVMENCDKIKKALGASVLLVHHSGKSAASGERGSSALRGAVDVSIEIEDLDGTIRVVCRKNKYDKGFADYRLGFITVAAREGETSIVPVPTAQIATEPDNLKISHTQRMVLEVLSQSIYNHPVDDYGNVLGARFADLQRELPNVNLTRTLTQLLDKNLVQRPPRKRDPWKISKEGERAMLIASKDKNKSKITTFKAAPESALEVNL